tara:strand:- start:2072 stop:3073 length:1002 start_codon:yes stop_codon:yes gene_type:complete
MTKKQLTFIIPIKDRPSHLKKLIKNIDKVLLAKISCQLIFVDASNNSNQKKNYNILKNYKNCKILIQKNKGITIGCFQAIPYVRSKFVTFLYDDDELGKYLYLVYKENLKNNKLFSMGTGNVQAINKKFNFKKITKINLNKKKVLLNYFGIPLSKTNNKFKKLLSAPVSPISTCFESRYLIQWKKHILKFVKDNEFRNYFILKKDIGPDLMIYLHNILKSKEYVNFFTPSVVKFSSHEDSISIIYGANNLRIGYWLAKLSILESEKKLNVNNKSYMYTYLVISGYFLFFSNLNNWFNLKNISSELFKLHKNYHLTINVKHLFLILNIWFFKRK